MSTVFDSKRRITDKPRTTPRREVPQSFYDFAGEFLQVQHKELGELMYLRKDLLNPPQIDLVDRIFANLEAGRPSRFIVCKARQFGISTIVAAVFTFLTGYHPRNERRLTLVMAHDMDTSGLLYDMPRIWQDLMPADVRAPTRRSNRKEVIFADTGSRYFVQIAMAPKASGGRGRGFMPGETSQGKGRGGQWDHMHLSEVAYYPNASVTMHSLLPALRGGGNSICVWESTANGRGNYFHQQYLAAKAGKGEYTALFYPWYLHPQYVKKPPKDYAYDADEKEYAERYGLTPAQMWWRRTTVESPLCGGDVDKFRQEYPANDEEAFLVQGDCWFDTLRLDRILSLTRDPERIARLEEAPRGFSIVDDRNGPLRIWREPESGQQYAIGADVGHGLRTGAASCAQVVNRRTLEQVAVWHGWIDPDLFAQQLVFLGHYYNVALIAPEINDSGILVPKRILDRRYPEERLYHHVMPSETGFTDARAPGWNTTLKTHHLLFGEGRAHVREMDAPINDADTVSEMHNIVDAGGKAAKIGDPKALHDRVMAWQIAVVVAKGRLMRYLDG